MERSEERTENAQKTTQKTLIRQHKKKQNVERTKQMEKLRKHS